MCSPTAGGAERDALRSRSNEQRERRAGADPGSSACSSGCEDATSARVCSALATSATSATGAAGTPAAVSRSRQSAVSRSRRRAGDERYDERLPVPHAVGVRPEALVRDELGQLEHRRRARPNSRSFPACDHQLAVAGGEDLVRRDHRERRSLPGRNRSVWRGSRPGGTRCSRGPSRRATSRPRCRRPVCSRSSSAATIPSADHMPVPMSMSDEPTRTPGRPALRSC